MSNETKLDRQLEAEFSAEMLDLKSKLKTITKEKTENNKGNMLRLVLPILAVAAGLALAIMFMPTLFQDNSSDGLYASNYEPYPMALNQRGGENASLNDAIAAYTAKDFAKASDLFNQLFNESKEAIYQLYVGSAQQAQGKYIEAIESYDGVLLLKDEKVKEQAQWYKALALLKLEKIEEANEMFSSFEKNHYKFEAAQKLLK